MAGLAEGADEIPVGACFPLEYNLDFCNGGMPTCYFFGDVSNFFYFWLKSLPFTILWGCIVRGQHELFGTRMSLCMAYKQTRKCCKCPPVI